MSLTHLQAFCSDDGKRGREWTDGCSNYKRHHDQLWMDAHRDGVWKFHDEQVATMDDHVTWVADDPKTLTPQDALRALAVGKCVRPAGGISDFIYRLDGSELKAWDTRMVPYKWRSSGNVMLRDCLIVPDPSQQAEPIKAPLKVGDRVKRGPDWKWGSQDNSGAGSIIAGACPAGDGWLWVKWDDGAQEVYRYGAEGKYDIEKIEAEPQVEYPLTYAEAEALARRGAHVTNEMFPHVTYAVIDSVPRLRTNKGGWFGDDWVTTRSEEVAKWRIVDGGK